MLLSRRPYKNLPKTWTQEPSVETFLKHPSSTQTSRVSKTSPTYSAFLQRGRETRAVPGGQRSGASPKRRSARARGRRLPLPWLPGNGGLRRLRSLGFWSFGVQHPTLVVDSAAMQRMEWFQQSLLYYVAAIAFILYNIFLQCIMLCNLVLISYVSNQT